MKKLFLLLMTTVMVYNPAARAADSLNVRIHGEIVTKTCSFRNNNLAFDFGLVNASDFAGVGTTTNWIEKSFISAGCDPAIKEVNMTFSGSADDNIPQLVKVEGGAEGVAIELRSYDDYLAVPDNMTQISWVPRKFGDEYKFKARLVQTTDRMKGGTLDAKVIVNITYM